MIWKVFENAVRSDIDYIKMEALSLPVGQTAQVACPSCGKAKLSITRKEDGIIYNCWIPHCSMSGIVGSIPNEILKGDKKVFVPRNYIGSFWSIKDKFYDTYLSKYGISLGTFEEQGVKQLEHKAGVIFPLHDVFGKRFGEHVKYFNTSDKAMSYFRVDRPKIHFVTKPAGDKDDTLFLVEDIISAIKINTHTRYPAAALLGTTMDDTVARTIINGGYKKIVIWLDHDAMAKAATIREKYALFFKSFGVTRTLCDPKDTPKSELKRIACQSVEG